MSDSIYEIERKFLLIGFPIHAYKPEYKKILVDQGWVGTKPFKVRLRKSTYSNGSSRYIWGTKTGSGISRIELESEITESLFDTLWPFTRHRRVQKLRYFVPTEDGLKWEIDDFLDRKLYLAEIEMPTADYDLKIPDWLKPFIDREVTNDDKFNNSALAK